MYDCSGCRGLLLLLRYNIKSIKINKCGRFGEEPPVSHSPVSALFAASYKRMNDYCQEDLFWLHTAFFGQQRLNEGVKSLKKKQYVFVSSLTWSREHRTRELFHCSLCTYSWNAITAKHCAFELYAKALLGPLNSIIGESNNVPSVRRPSLFPWHINLFFLLKKKAVLPPWKHVSQGSFSERS